MKTWLKGGIIVGSIFLLISIFAGFFVGACISDQSVGIKEGCGFGAAGAMLIINLPGLLITGGKLFVKSGMLFYISHAFISLIVYFLIGAIIGLIYGKFKE